MNRFVCRPAVDADEWDAFVRRASFPHEFLESWAWGSFQEQTAKRVERLVVHRDGATVAVALLVPHTTRLRKSFFLVPRGPVLDPRLSEDDERGVWRELLASIDHVRSADTMFLKTEPNCRPPADLGLEPGTPVHPELTLLLDLRKSEDELLADMHPKTRYNIRLSERKGVEVRWSRSPEDLEAFLSMLQATARRQGIGVFPSAYYRTMVRTFGDAVEVAVACLREAVLAGAIHIRFGDTVTYVHGASASEHRELMAPHFLHWQTIRRAKNAGALHYDFFGIAPEGSVDHPWNGITRFKLGFGGKPHAYPGAFNVVYQRGWYLAYRLAKRLAGR